MHILVRSQCISAKYVENRSLSVMKRWNEVPQRYGTRKAVHVPAWKRVQILNGLGRQQMLHSRCQSQLFIYEYGVQLTFHQEKVHVLSTRIILMNT